MNIYKSKEGGKQRDILIGEYHAVFIEKDNKLWYTTNTGKCWR